MHSRGTSKYDSALTADDCSLKRFAQPTTVSSYPHLREPKADGGTAVTRDDATARDVITTGDDGDVAHQPCRDIGEIYLICRAAATTSKPCLVCAMLNRIFTCSLITCPIVYRLAPLLHASS
jgi:hypothetical protein